MLSRAIVTDFDARPDRRFIENISRALPHGWRHGIDCSHILLGECGALRTDERYAIGACRRSRATSARPARRPGCRGRSGTCSTEWG
jgi:hypothetical protein